MSVARRRVGQSDRLKFTEGLSAKSKVKWKKGASAHDFLECCLC